MGPPGVDGTDGEDGTDSNAVQARTLCTGSFDQNGKLLRLEYSVVEFTNRDVFVSCSVSDLPTQSSDSQFFGAWQDESQSHTCTVTYALGSDTFGYWTFELGDTFYAATYSNLGGETTNTLVFDGSTENDPRCVTKEQ